MPPKRYKSQLPSISNNYVIIKTLLTIIFAVLTSQKIRQQIKLIIESKLDGIFKKHW